MIFRGLDVPGFVVHFLVSLPRWSDIRYLLHELGPFFGVKRRGTKII